jgi:4-diphosphocytidyl-2-C-methyl-D-erythritol kinase
MISTPSFAKINLGLKIGVARPDGFHELRTVYQTLAVHDVVRVDTQPGSGIEIRCDDHRVPLDATNTCSRIAERFLRATAASCKVIVEIEKQLPVQGGMGAASSNAVATMLGLERALAVKLSLEEKLRIAAEVGSDLPLFLIGGTVLGLGRGEEVYALPDSLNLDVVVVTPSVGVSTPKAFAAWDEAKRTSDEPAKQQLTGSGQPRTITAAGREVLDWLAESIPRAEGSASGVPAVGGDRAETPLLDLVRAGIENDFERVVFPEYPELCEVKELLLREGAQYASLSGSGSTVYGLFAAEREARDVAERMSGAGHNAIATRTLSRAEYWKSMASG